MSGSADVPARLGSETRHQRGALFQRPTRALRRDLSQLVCAVVGLALGLLVPRLSGGPRVESGQVATLLFTIGFGVISLVSIIYSVLFLVVQFSASTFTPRLGLFRDEPIVWRAFAFTIGVFVFCITSGLAIGGASGTVSVVVPLVAMLLTLVSLALMRTLQMKAFDSIQLAHALTAIVTRAHRLFDTLYVRPYDPREVAAAPPPAAGAALLRWQGPGAVLQQIDVAALVGAAKAHDCSIALRVAPGQAVSQGVALADVRGGRLPERVLRDHMVTGLERTFHQDPQLPLRLLVDIALRALSPAVNDPATAVDCLDRLEDLLTRLAGRDLDVGRFADDDGALRVTVPVPGWEQFVRTAVDDLVFAAGGSPMALRRMRTLLARLVEQSPEGRRGVLRDRLGWVHRTGSEASPLTWEDPADG
ncbi:DUF2254 family protein [Streptomyces sp. NPDC006544]|uniref:DUF2254 family protein n=1 Tax=Streptomyces sp. NPDC006544 TaxID=3154583 RepID=UPI00339F2D82